MLESIIKNRSHVSFKSMIFLFGSIFLFSTTTGCRALKLNAPNGIRDQLVPSNLRDWAPDLAILPSAEIEGTNVTVRNIRNCSYVSNSDYIVQHYDRTFTLVDIQTVDFVVVPFQTMPALAHTMLSFGLSDGTYLGVSVEIRTEKGEKYNPFLGLGNQFELTYVVADERDLIGVRTAHRDADVYVYPSVATPQQSQELFVDVMKRINKLIVEPEFYHSIHNNCTTNLADHVNKMRPGKIAYGWKVLLPGFSAKYAYDLGLLTNEVPFEDLKETAHVNELATLHFNDPQFSQKIRAKHKRISRLARHHERRQAHLDTSQTDSPVSRR